MDLIISEKAIAGKRIAKILSNNKFKTVNKKGVNCFKFKSNNKKFLIIPLRGHINSVDFSKDNKYWSIYTLDSLVEQKLYYQPTYKNIVNELKKKRKDLKNIIIATDADREGEAIGCEAYDYIKKNNKNFDLKRAYFSALTKNEIENAFDDFRKLDFDYANSVFARQEIDLLWGAILTRYLSVAANRKGRRFLSAGRVQTPLLNLIVKRKIARDKFKSKPYNVLKILFIKDDITFEGIHKNKKFFEIQKSEKIYNNIKNQKKGKVKSIKKRTRTIRKPAPFNTTSFLRAASAIGVSTSRAIKTAENLYQKGIISYPRTDNTVYPKSLDLKKILNKLKANPKYTKFVKEILKGKLKASRGKKQTSDHPPIHPVNYQPSLKGINKKIFDLIARRFMATLSKNAKTKNISAIIAINKEPFIVTGQRIIQQGWKKIYIFSKLNESLLPDLKKEDLVNIKKPIMENKETKPPNHYTEGSLIKLMESKNLGTKSTRPGIIKKLRNRGYITGKKKLIANDIAVAVCKVLNSHCSLITKPKLTALTEEEMDKIASGKKEKKEVVGESRDHLKKIIKILKDERKKISRELRDAAKADNIIGKCTKCGKSLIIRISRNNKQFIGCTGYPKCKNTFPLPQRKKIKKTDKVCEYCDNPIIKVLNGRRTYEMCINPKCKSKEEYFKKKEERMKKKKNKKKKAKK